MKDPRERIVIAIILLIFIIAIFSVMVIAEGGVITSARSALLYEPTEYGAIYEKNADVRLPMASTTKIMTALVALESCDENTLVEIPKEAVGIEGSSLYLTDGEVLTMGDLVYALMLRSANDVAEAIAITIGGSTEGFAEMMNSRAASMGLTDTHFDNPHGLYTETHYTTARELAIITAEALKNPKFKEICSTYKTTIKNTAGDVRLVVNHNKLLRLYDGAIGVKTGYTKKCGRCLVGAAERDGLTFITVTIDAPDDWNDHIKMFDLGFSKLENRLIADKEQFSYTLSVLNSEKQEIRVTNSQPLYKILPRDLGDIESQVRLTRYTSAPVAAGDIMGEVIFTKDGRYIGKLDLTAVESAEQINKKGLFSFIF